jgi:predicted Zn finger-like uncharacterized protein
MTSGTARPALTGVPETYPLAPDFGGEGQGVSEIQAILVAKEPMPAERNMPVCIDHRRNQRPVDDREHCSSPMQIRCPNCQTEYLIETVALASADGRARCHRCDTVFDVATGKPVDSQSAVRPLMLDLQSEADLPESPARQPAASDAAELPFEVPDDLEPLQPSPEAALDVNEALNAKRSGRGPLYTSVALLLAAGLGLQLAWQHREELLRQYPQLEPLCERLPCVADRVHAPDKLRVLQRELRPADNQPGSLTLSARFRNEAEADQPLPDIQLSLIDNDGKVLIRRRLQPGDYLYPPPPDDRVIAAGEVITISVDFKDPGYLATGFVLDFL